ncbi:uncharacterized protein LOC110642215 [Hevea brasiliensis]|uniref:uncharacterized protein LOC110642215 n=1 Tax=Hevea brasiliensis TaxID=3981 RepID=UPI0025E729D2|nr:uncharacterized protein LOC110642215 [Hevea brasiliensis]
MMSQKNEANKPQNRKWQHKNKTINSPSTPTAATSFWARKTATISVTNQEIAKFWRQKHIEEEDHLFAAEKAAAREEDYKRFEESLKDENGTRDTKEYNINATLSSSTKDENKKEVRVGIKDWWTKSKYAYLNQPAIELMVPAKRSSNYVPNGFSFNSTPLCNISLGRYCF